MMVRGVWNWEWGHVHVGVVHSRRGNRFHGGASLCGHCHDDETAVCRGCRRNPLLLFDLGFDEVDAGVDFLAQLPIHLFGRGRKSLADNDDRGQDSVWDPERGKLRVALLGPAHGRLDSAVGVAAHRAPRQPSEHAMLLLRGRRVRLGRGALAAALGGERANLAAGGAVARGTVLTEAAGGAAAGGFGVWHDDDDGCDGEEGGDG